MHEDVGLVGLDGELVHLDVELGEARQRVQERGGEYDENEALGVGDCAVLERLERHVDGDEAVQRHAHVDPNCAELEEDGERVDELYFILRILEFLS